MKQPKETFEDISDTAEIEYASETCFGINWSRKGKGFGELNFIKRDGVWKLRTETMGKKHAKRILEILIDSLELLD